VKSETYKQIFEGKAIQAHFIRQLLEDNGISSLVIEDSLSQVFPLFVASGELQPVKLYVGNEDYANSLNLIRIYTIAKLDQKRQKREKS
jgi:hypothetical protein